MNPGAALSSRMVDRGLARWVQARTGSALLARAVFAASVAEGEGHACVVLDGVFGGAELDALRASAWVGDGSSFSPFVIDASARFYLWRNWRHEQALANDLLARCTSLTPAHAGDALDPDLQALFGDADVHATRRQRAAVAEAVGKRLFVLTGGPGTGKTTTVVRMLLMQLRHRTSAGLPAQPAIALAAPTGKAAQRLAQAIARGKAGLARHLPPDSPFRLLLDAIPQAEARTLHRLLGYRPASNTFAHGRAHPLPADMVVVDEASMVDLALMRHLLEALREDALLILLGDPDQLASVDAGSVLADIVASARPAPGADGDTAETPPLADHIVTLDHVWRAGGSLARGIEALRDADGDWLDAFLAHAGDDEIRIDPCTDAATLRACISAWLDAHADVQSRLFERDAAPADALAWLRESQLLCALREGPFGAQGVNALVTRLLAARHDFDPVQPWYAGRPVIIGRNDYARGLFNGDIGITLAGPEGLRVWFESSGRDGTPVLRSYSPRVLPACETAWAITVHRSQGSEYGDVALLLPPDAANPLLTRELVYTGVSRARRHARLWALPDVLRAAVARATRRDGGLRERLRRGR